MIRELGFEVIEATDADHAVSLLESNPDIRIVFTDIQMPGSMASACGSPPSCAIGGRRSRS